MNDETPSNIAMVQVGSENIAVTGQTGPIITFEIVPSFGHLVGLIDVCLMTTRATIGPGGKTIREANVVANLRCTQAGAVALRNALNDALLMLVPVEKPEGPKN